MLRSLLQKVQKGLNKATTWVGQKVAIGAKVVDREVHEVSEYIQENVGKPLDEVGKKIGGENVKPPVDRK